ncbi:MAG: glycosyltransferase family 4 protein [Micromonosporaceae bacterium]|nr:glycosyltransferase family 4 protein [Micromonosporaceae bacterium]
MRIALLGPITWRTPPRAYGPWEQVVSLLADGLAARGVDVTLFATLDSVTPAAVDGVCPRPYGEDPTLDGRVWEALHVGHCLARSGEFDLVHNHLDWLPLAMARVWRAPLLTTVHGFSSPAILPAYQAAAAAGARFVSISNADRAEGLPYVATIYHGIDVSQFPFRARPGEHLVAFGRIHPDKGTADAIEIARRAGRPLVICGPVHDRAYYAERVEPHIDGERVRYLGNVGPADRAEVLGGAVALLHPIGFAEPFGLSVVEAMMCGTPVLAYPKGAMPELIEPGRTGLLVDSVEAAADAVADAARLDRSQVRDIAESRFSAARMVDEYLHLYEKIVADT